MNTYTADDHGTSGRLTAFVAGALMGASVALLLAPMRGSELRASIGERSRSGKDRLRQISHQGREWAQDTARQANVKSRDVLQRATERVDTAVDRAHTAINHGVERAHEATDRARNALNRSLETARLTAHDAERLGKDAIARVEERL